MKLDETINEELYLIKNNKLENDIKDLLDEKSNIKNDNYLEDKNNFYLEDKNNFYLEDKNNFYYDGKKIIIKNP